MKHHSSRWTLEGSGTLEPRRSALEDDFEEEEEKEEEEPAAGAVEQAEYEKVSRKRSAFYSISVRNPDISN